MDGTTWVPYNRSMHESTMVYVSNDRDGSVMVVGRAHHSGELIPGKVLTRHGKIHVSYNGQEIPLTNFEVLINSGGFTWQEASNGVIPPYAVVGGNASNGETLYVGRARHGNAIVPGKVHPSHRCCYYPSDWKEHSKTTYEVLVQHPSHLGGGGNPMGVGGGGVHQGWVTGPEMLPPQGGVPVFPNPPGMGMGMGVTSTPGGQVKWQRWSAGRPWPTNAVQAGIYKEGGSHQPQFIARRRHQMSTLLGYAYQNGPFYASFHGGELVFQDFDVLVDNSGVFPKEHL